MKGTAMKVATLITYLQAYAGYEEVGFAVSESGEAQTVVGVVVSVRRGKNGPVLGGRTR